MREVKKTCCNEHKNLVIMLLNHEFKKVLTSTKFGIVLINVNCFDKGYTANISFKFSLYRSEASEKS